ncbi:MAG TPA: MgtC/SapB family protein [Candidatus Methylacidiphilales bacterium]
MELALSGLFEVSSGEVFLRIGAAAVLGGLVGLNRDLHGKPAGLRTHSVVAVGAAALALFALRPVAATLDGNALSRVVQGIVTGIGFLGAGVILRSQDGKHVHGLTTAATVWLVAALGIGCGMGYWSAVAAMATFTFLVLLCGGAIEKAFHRRFRPKDDMSEPPNT